MPDRCSGWYIAMSFKLAVEPSKRQGYGLAFWAPNLFGRNESAKVLGTDTKFYVASRPVAELACSNCLQEAISIA